MLSVKKERTQLENEINENRRTSASKTVPVQKVREKRNRYTFAEQKPPKGYNYTHS
jgi:hypothetical protein